VGHAPRSRMRKVLLLTVSRKKWSLPHDPRAMKYVGPWTMKTVLLNFRFFKARIRSLCTTHDAGKILHNERVFALVRDGFKMEYKRSSSCRFFLEDRETRKPSTPWKNWLQLESSATNTRKMVVDFHKWWSQQHPSETFQK